MKKVFFSLVLGAVALTSCSRDNDDNPVVPETTDPNVTTITDLDASNRSKWVYFSFETGKEVEITDPENDLTWDIAFNRFNIKTNGGTSGSGQAGVFNTLNTDFGSVTEIPSSATYTSDSMVSSPGMGGTTTVTQSLNSVITGTVQDSNSTGWYNYVMHPNYTLSKYIYIVKTAKENFVKIQLTSYANSTTSATGFITFHYKKANSNNSFN